MDMTLRPATSANRIQPRAFGPRLARHRGAWRWPNWAVRLARRYGAQGETWDRLAATLRAVGPAQTPVYQQVTWHNRLYQTHQWPLALTVHLALRATSAGNRTATGHAPAGVSGLATVVVRHTTPVLPDGMRSAAEPQWTTPLTTRQARLSPTVSPAATQHATLRTVLAQPSAAPRGDGVAPASLALPPLPRVVQRPPAATPAPPPPTAAPALPAALHHWGDPAPTAAVPVVNVEQLTDHVIRAIDQRVVAARERLGKS